MSERPEDRNRDTRKAAENNIEQAPPLNKQDPTQPVEVEGSNNSNTAAGGQGAQRQAGKTAGAAGGQAGAAGQ